MRDPVGALLAELKQGLGGIYGDRLRGIYLYGSYARGRQGPESDLDVLIVLDEVLRYAAEVDRTGELVSQLSLRYGVTISRLFVSERDWSEGGDSFLVSAREEAIPA